MEIKEDNKATKKMFSEIFGLNNAEELEAEFDIPPHTRGDLSYGQITKRIEEAQTDGVLDFYPDIFKGTSPIQIEANSKKVVYCGEIKRKMFNDMEII